MELFKTQIIKFIRLYNNLQTEGLVATPTKVQRYSILSLQKQQNIVGAPFPLVDSADNGFTYILCQ
jgi:hypothetical protein